MHAINGSVPAEQLEQLVQRIRRDPPHPGSLIRSACLPSASSLETAARLLDLEPAAFIRILDGDSSVSPDLAVRMEALGWSSAELWMKLQAAYDLAQARRRFAQATPPIRLSAAL